MIDLYLVSDCNNIMCKKIFYIGCVTRRPYMSKRSIFDRAKSTLSIVM